MTSSPTNNDNIKPGGRIAFGGGLVNRADRHGCDTSLIKQFNTKYLEYIISTKSKRILERELGLIANEMKRQCKHGSFIQMLKKEFPYLSKRTIERWMKIAVNVPFSEYPAFFLVSQNDLIKIINRFDSFDEALLILEDNGVSLKPSENDQKLVNIFLYKIGLLANGEMGYLSPLEEEKHETSKAIVNGWEICQHKGKVLRAETEIEITKKVNATEYIPKQFLTVAQEIRKLHKETGEAITKDSFHTFVNIVEEIFQILSIASPQVLINRKFKNILSKFEEIASDQFSYSDDDDDPDDLEDNDDDYDSDDLEDDDDDDDSDDLEDDDDDYDSDDLEDDDDDDDSDDLEDDDDDYDSDDLEDDDDDYDSDDLEDDDDDDDSDDLEDDDDDYDSDDLDDDDDDYDSDDLDDDDDDYDSDDLEDENDDDDD